MSPLDIAIVGAGGVLPGCATLDDFWELIVRRGDTARDPPAGRWIVDPASVLAAGVSPDHVYSLRACFVEHEPPLDSSRLALEPGLLDGLDRLYRIVLSAGQQAWAESAVRQIDRGRIGVILAAIALPTEASSALTRAAWKAEFERSLFAAHGAAPDAAAVLSRVTRDDARAARVTALPASLLARALRLGGGSYTLDAACASSLYAIRLACDELRDGRLDAALAGGVSRPDSLFTQMGFCQLRALSPTGRCAPFDAAADGLIVGEGAGVFLLKRLEDAERDGDAVLGVIRAIGLSNDVGGSLLAPDGEGQLRAMRAAYAQAGWSPLDVDLVECHGTGTPVGDAVELAALARLREDARAAGSEVRSCAIGSVKSNVGHLLTAAGAAGLLKVLLALRNGTLPPSANVARPALSSAALGSALRVQTEAQPWRPRAVPEPDSESPARQAAVSAFGFGGINAHLLVEEYRPARVERNRASSGTPARRRHASPAAAAREPVAIVGLALRTGAFDSPAAFRDALFLCGEAGSDRIAALEVPIGRFRIPPAEIAEILPQQLLMLSVAADALRTARIDTGQRRPRAGVLIGMGFDFEATNYSFRWSMPPQARRWAQRAGVATEGPAFEAWLRALCDAAGPPLNAPRVLGALGNIIASRIAREFNFGGPGFALSSEESSGLQALDIARRVLASGECDLMLVGAVDFAGDARAAACNAQLRAAGDPVGDRPRDIAGADAAVALVLKRLSDAQRDGDDVWAVVAGVGRAADFEAGRSSVDAASRAFHDACEAAGAAPATVSLVETHRAAPSAVVAQIEQAAPGIATGDAAVSGCALSQLDRRLAGCGAAVGLVSLAKAALSLQQRLLPPMPADRLAEVPSAEAGGRLHVPRQPAYWFGDRAVGPRRAAVLTETLDGGAACVVVEEAPVSPRPVRPATAGAAVVGLSGGLSRFVPPEARAAGLFVCGAGDRQELTRVLAALDECVRGHGGPLCDAARAWHTIHPPPRGAVLRVCLVATERELLLRRIAEVRAALDSGAEISERERDGVFVSAEGTTRGQLALVYPGSGNHYLGMGRELMLSFPQVIRRLEAESASQAAQFAPREFVPWRRTWTEGWRADAERRAAADMRRLIFAQVSFGVFMTDLLGEFGVRPDAVIGYSLGESSALFATRTWRDRDEMLRRMLASPLFATELAPPYDAVRRAWRLPEGESVDWCVMLVPRPPEALRAVLRPLRRARLLIVNTPGECVLGGLRRDVEAAVAALGHCRSVELEGVASVHCDVVGAVGAAYRGLHVFDRVQPPPGVRFYSAHAARSYVPTRDAAAEAILAHALEGFDFAATIQRAWADGVRTFVEVGPQASCTRMIGRTLRARPHLAVSASGREPSETANLLRALAALIAAGVEVDLSPLYGPADADRPSALPPATAASAGPAGVVTVLVGHVPGPPPPPPSAATAAAPPPMFEILDAEVPVESVAAPQTAAVDTLVPDAAAAGEAHGAFLDFSAVAADSMARVLEIQRGLAEELNAAGVAAQSARHDLVAATVEPPADGRAPAEPRPAIGDGEPPPVAPPSPRATAVPTSFDRRQCIEFARGRISDVLGPTFAEADTFPTRVRLPAEPLMLVDRIVRVDATPHALDRGRIVTEHDVRAGAWYLDGGRAPVCIAVESGQADLFLSAYLGIDFQTRGRRMYRLLDATVEFHRDLPLPGETIRYEIEIERFIRQGETWIFAFRFVGRIGGVPLLTMRSGRAGFFTLDEVRNSGGIILTAQDAAPTAASQVVTAARRFVPGELVPVTREALSDQQMAALRRGDLAGCFGPHFARTGLHQPARIPDGRMKLVDRVLEIDPRGGAYGLGRIRAAADVHPDDWFLTCHFVDDQTMPGTLMYECCVHTLRILLLRYGWVAEQDEICYQPLPGLPTQLRCRGPVTPETRQVIYQVDIKEIGYRSREAREQPAGGGLGSEAAALDEPYCIADALMFADGKRIVQFKNMSLRLSGATRARLEQIWAGQSAAAGSRAAAAPPPPVVVPIGELPIVPRRAAIFDSDRILAFAVGKPSDAFGERYRVFDEQRRIARLPGPPFQFLDRVTHVAAEAWRLEPGGWIEAQYDVSREAWYFAANRQPAMPYSVLLEVALQPCGWLAAFLGSALHSRDDLSFRNLDGAGTVYRDVFAHSGTLTVRVRISDVAIAGGMIIEKFASQVWMIDAQGRPAIVYDLKTTFGFFSQAALRQQVGIRDAARRACVPSPDALRGALRHTLPSAAPHAPAECRGLSDVAAVPARAFRMIDELVIVPDGGPRRLGFMRGTTGVDPAAWFFAAHFYQDPVWPGSLGLESFLQLLKFEAARRFSAGAEPRFESIALNEPHQWSYRGQITPANTSVEVDAAVTRAAGAPAGELFADGFLRVDGVAIYEMKNFGVRLAGG
ncbi:MAG: hypothetical protein CHACPFDD_03754 [Phycisphaerae bacterium]|nr:hypothetical protein [Phycisphaerae bacterium]